MTNFIVYDHKGNQIQLISTGMGGGEACIYLIQGKVSECAKIYYPRQITIELQKKILAMVNNPPDDPTLFILKHRSFAWPNAILYKDSKKIQFMGFTMSLLDQKVFKESYKYYDPIDRLKEFGGSFTWKHLFSAAYNITRSIEAIHEKGFCIGDLRETNIFVAPSALITFIDCDSFQVKEKDSGKVFYTRVGIGEYLPPELMSVNFKNQDIDRYYSDLFALGILIFKLLMNGVHPFQAKGPLVDGAPSTEAKIKKGYFAFAGIYKGVVPPEYAPPYEIIPPVIQELFDRCFVDGHKKPQIRPTAKEWVDVLKKVVVKIKKCNLSANHLYSDHLSYCPWCKIAGINGKDPFPISVGDQIIPIILSDSLDNRIRKLPIPEIKHEFIEKQSVSKTKSIDVKSSYVYKGATIQFKVKIENPTTEPVADIKITLFVPDIFLIPESAQNIALLKSGESKTVTFEVRPTGECGTCEVSGKVEYYDYSCKKTREVDIPPKNLSIISPIIKSKDISEDMWRALISKFMKTEESTMEIEMPGITLFDIISDIMRDMNLFMLEPKRTESSGLYRASVRFYGEGVKGLKYAAQAEVLGGQKKSKFIIKAWAEQDDALVGFYHGIWGEIEKRIHVKQYIDSPIVQHFYHFGDKIGSRFEGDVVAVRSNIGIGTRKCPECEKDIEANEKFCHDCGARL